MNSVKKLNANPQFWNKAVKRLRMCKRRND